MHLMRYWDKKAKTKRTKTRKQSKIQEKITDKWIEKIDGKKA